MIFKYWPKCKRDVEIIYVDRDVHIPQKLWFIAWAVLGISIFHVLFVYITIASSNSLNSQVLPRVFDQLDRIERRLISIDSKLDTKQ